MKRSVFAKRKIHADWAAFRLLHFDLELAARVQITSQRYFMLGLAVDIAYSFLEMKAPAVSNMPKGCAAAGCTELATKDCLYFFHAFPTKPDWMKAWLVNMPQSSGNFVLQATLLNFCFQ